MSALKLSACLTAVVIAGCAVTAEPFTTTELAEFAYDKRSRVVQDQEPLSGPVTLYEAMARALKYNLDKQVEEMEVVLRSQQLRVAHYSLLPDAIAGAGYADRTNFSGGTSVALLGPRTTGAQSLTSSTSSERDVRTADLRFSWHVLDFGLSWIRAKQAADQVLIAEENRRRVANRIIENVRTAYWRAVAAKRLLFELGRLESRVERALADTRALVARGASSPLTALTYERELVEIQREIRSLDDTLSTAKTQLAALMNEDPGVAIDVAIPHDLPPPRHFSDAPESMIATALQNRSELREVAYQERINTHEAEVAILEMLPGVSFSAAPNWNSNQFLFSNQWVAWGAQASWNLMKVFSYADRAAEVEAKSDLLDRRALAVTMAIMTQVHVGRARLIHARRIFRTAEHYRDVQERIRGQIRSALAAGKVSEQTAIREEMNTLVAGVKLDLAYAELQGAFAALHASMGLMPYAEIDPTMLSVDELTDIIQRSWNELGDRLG